MTTSSAVTSTTTTGSRKLAPLAAITILAAAAVNLGLYAIGRATDASLTLDPGAGAPNHLVTAPDVAWKTMVPLALGALVLALVSRRSRRWTTILTATGVSLAMLGAIFPFLGAHDTVTGALLLGMHTTTAIAAIVIGARARRNAPA